MNRLEWKQNPLTIHQSQLSGVNGFRSHISFYSLQSNQKLGGGITLFSWPNGSRSRANIFHAVERSQTMQKHLNLLSRTNNNRPNRFIECNFLLNIFEDRLKLIIRFFFFWFCLLTISRELMEDKMSFKSL